MQTKKNNQKINLPVGFQNIRISSKKIKYKYQGEFNVFYSDSKFVPDLFFKQIIKH